MLNEFDIPKNRFNHIYKEMQNKGYICSPHIVFMRNLRGNSNKFCNKYKLDEINIMITGSFFDFSPNADSYILFDTDKIEYEEATKILRQCAEKDSFFSFI